MSTPIRTTFAGAPAPYMNPYLAGIGLGLVLLASFVVMGRGLGASGAFSSACAVAVDAVAPAHAAGQPLLAATTSTSGVGHPLKEWLVFEVLGVLVGGFLSGLLAGRVRRTVEKGPRISIARPLRLRLRRRRPDGHRRQARPRLHQRPGADRRGAALRRRLGLHDDGLRRRLRRRLDDAGGSGYERPVLQVRPVRRREPRSSSPS